MASIAGVFIVSRFPRRKLLLAGYFFMTGLNLLIAIGMATVETNMTYLMMVAFLILYQIFNGSIVLLYLAETCTDVAFAITSLL